MQLVEIFPALELYKNGRNTRNVPQAPTTEKPAEKFEDRWWIGTLTDPIAEKAVQRIRGGEDMQEVIEAATWDAFLAALDEVRLLCMAFESLPGMWDYPDKYMGG